MRRIYDNPDQYYFITSKTFRNKTIFNNAKNIKSFLNCVNYLIKKKCFKLYGWVIMPNHFHLLFEIIGNKNISEVMHDLKSYTANQISKLILNRGAEASAAAGDVNSLASVDEASLPRRKAGNTNASMSAEMSLPRYIRNINTPTTEDEASLPRLPHQKIIKIWQKSFHDHIIRDQQDLYNHLDYIHYNPVKHNYVTKPELWPWSSYKIFLKRNYYEIGWGWKEP